MICSISSNSNLVGSVWQFDLTALTILMVFSFQEVREVPEAPRSAITKMLSGGYISNLLGPQVALIPPIYDLEVIPLWVSMLPEFGPGLPSFGISGGGSGITDGP